MPKVIARPNVFARAARNMERRRGTVRPDIYPCFYVMHAKGIPAIYWKRDLDVHRFLSAFSAKETTELMSTEFIMTVDLDDERDVSILALCFAAAMAETGDLGTDL